MADPRYPNCIDAGHIGFPDEHNETDILEQRVYSEDEFEVGVLLKLSSKVCDLSVLND